MERKSKERVVRCWPEFFLLKYNNVIVVVTKTTPYCKLTLQ